MNLKFLINLEFGLIIVLLIHSESYAGELKMSRLFKDIMQNYDRNIRPARNFSETVTIFVKLKLSQLLDLNFQNNWMETSVKVEEEWIDYQLQWNPSSYDYITEIVVPAEYIWVPDLSVYNNVDGNLRISPKSVRIHRTGKVTAKTFTIIKTHCEFDKSLFPFDEQHCFIKLGSWTYDGDKMDIRHKDQLPDNNTVEAGVDLSEFYHSVEWNILKAPATRHVKFYNCCAEPYTDLFFDLYLERRSFAYQYSVIFPWIIFTCLPLFTFLLPANSNLKIPYSVFLLILLISTVTVFSSTQDFPMFLMKRFYVFTTVIVSLSLLSAVFILNIQSRENEPVPQIIRNIAKKISDYVLIEWQDEKPASGTDAAAADVPEDNVDSNQVGKSQDVAGRIPEWEQIANILDRSLLGIFLIVCIFGIIVILV